MYLFFPVGTALPSLNTLTQLKGDSRSSKRLREYMKEDLPSISAQKRLLYRTDIKEVTHLFHLLNDAIFDNKLKVPEFVIFSRSQDHWGLCEATDYTPNLYGKKSNVRIHMWNKWYCRQWLIDVLAHEMCHQYQWDILSKNRLRKGLDPLMSHGPSFFKFRDKLEKHHIILRRGRRMRTWFKYQNFAKC